MMLTRCPACSTAFRVSAEQLKVKQGQVRCGQCREVFNALETLVDELEQESAAIEVQPAAETATPQSEPPPEATALASEALAATPEADPEPEPIYAQAAAETPQEQSWPSYLDEGHTAPSYTRSKPLLVWLWGAAALGAALLLSLQLLLHFRNELALGYPSAKPLLGEFCSLFGLDLPLPHKADLLAIETSDLHPGDEAQLLLAATLKNRAPYAQAYPHLELTLTDIADLALLRKVLTPADYLPAGIDAASGFVANGELALKLKLEASVAGAVGYRIYLFYP